MPHRYWFGASHVGDSLSQVPGQGGNNDFFLYLVMVNGFSKQHGWEVGVAKRAGL